MPTTATQVEAPGEQVAKALADFPIYSPPKRLYRFSSGPGLKALVDGTLKISPPKDFNDPFELLPGIVTANLTAGDVIQSLLAPNGLFRQVQKSRGTVVSDEIAYRANVEIEVRSSPIKWALHLKSLRDALAETFRENLAVCCFSAFKDTDLTGEIGIRHWSMYADHHRGLAIEYEGAHPYFQSVAKQKFLFPVEYCAKRVTTTLSDFYDWNDAKMWQRMRRWTGLKSRLAWGREKEWRLVVPLRAFSDAGFVRTERRRNGTRFFLKLYSGLRGEGRMEMASIVRRVVLGANAPKSLRTALIHLLETEPTLRHVELAEAQLSVSSFGLQILPIDLSRRSPRADAKH